MAAPTFSSQQLGTAEDWANPQVSWQRLKAAHGGALTPEQSAYADQQIGAGASAANPFASGSSGPINGGGLAPAGTTQGGVMPASPIAPSTTSTTVTGAGGTSSIATSPDGATTGTAPVIPLGSTNANDPMQKLLREKVMGLLGTDQNAASLSDPDLAPQAQTYEAARERQRREQQRGEAERMNAMGLASSGAADSAVRKGYETAGQDVAAYDAGLVGDKMDKRRQTLQNAIAAASQLGMAQEAADLSRQLGGLNAQIATMGIGSTQQNQKFQTAVANMDAQTKTYLANLDADLRKQGFSTAERLARMENEMKKYGIDVQGNLGLLSSVIQMMGMGQQNTQFNDTLGWDMAKFGVNQNNALITAILGGK